MLSEEKNKWLRDVMGIRVDFAEVEPDEGNTYGAIGLAKGAEYDGEYEKQGWRAAGIKQKAGESDADFTARKKRAQDSKVMTTYAFDEDERAANTIDIGDDGKLRDGNGRLIDEKMLYAIDAKTGEMVVNTEGFELRDVNEDGTPGKLRDITGKSPTEVWNMFLKERADGKKVRIEVRHHSSMLPDEKVAGAGFIEAKDGIVKKVTNESGHFKPQFLHLLQVVEGLLKSGALQTRDLMQYNPETESWVPASEKAKKLHAKVSPLLAGLPEDQKVLTAGLKQLDDPDLGEDAKKELEPTVAKLTKKISAIQKAMDVLRQMGVSPDNRVRGDVDVEYVYAKPDMDGKSFISADKKKMDVEEFLAGGEAIKPEGAKSPLNRVGDPHRNVLDDLKREMKERKLRPEDQKDGKGSIFEGTAPARDLDEWEKDVDASLSALNASDRKRDADSAEGGASEARHGRANEAERYVDSLGDGDDGAKHVYDVPALDGGEPEVVKAQYVDSFYDGIDGEDSPPHTYDDPSVDGGEPEAVKAQYVDSFYDGIDGEDSPPHTYDDPPVAEGDRDFASARYVDTLDDEDDKDPAPHAYDDPPVAEGDRDFADARYVDTLDDEDDKDPAPHAYDDPPVAEGDRDFASARYVDTLDDEDDEEAPDTSAKA